MLRFLLRRLLHGAVLLLLISMLGLALLSLAPGDFFTSMRVAPDVGPETAAALRAQFGLDQPFAVRYARWLAAAAHGDLGVSFAYNRPVAGLLRARAANTVLLTVTALLAAWLIAIPWGVWAGAVRGSWLDRASSAVVGVLLAVPDLVLALLLLLLAARTGWLPSGGMQALDAAGMTWWPRLSDLARHLLLPASALTLTALPAVWSHTRASVAETIDSPFVAAAVAHGLSRRRILFRHVLPAAANPVISLLGVVTGGLLSSSLLVEVVFGWPGLGPLLFEAVDARDIYVIQADVLASALFLIAGTLIADLLLYRADPRIRT